MTFFFVVVLVTSGTVFVFGERGKDLPLHKNTLSYFLTAFLLLLAEAVTAVAWLSTTKSPHLPLIVFFSYSLLFSLFAFRV